MRIHFSKVVSFCVASTVLVAAGVAAQQVNGWQTINADGVFTFRLPVGFKRNEQGVDSFMLGYQRGHARFISICGDSASTEYHDENISHLRKRRQLSTENPRRFEASFTNGRALPNT